MSDNAIASMTEARLAGGAGAAGASQGPEAQLRRAVMSCLLWENLAYENGAAVAKNIAELVPQVAPATVAAIAVEARIEQKLRHVPLFLCREMLRYPEHKKFVHAALTQCIRRADELSEFVAMYWKTGGKPKNVPHQAKLALADAFGKFDEYQLAKYDRAKEVRLVDVLRLSHPTPKSEAQSELWARLTDGNLTTPDTWEVGLSAAKTADEKREVWERLIASRKLGASALLRNLRNMLLVGVSRQTIMQALQTAKVEMLLPLDFFKAATHAPDFAGELNQMMLRCLAGWPKLPGETILVVDVSGSMGTRISAQSEFRRFEAAAAMAVLAQEMCETPTIYVTAGRDATSKHKTKRLETTSRGFALAREITDSAQQMGGGGIFTRQCLEYIREERQKKQLPTPARIAVFSDSQDCDPGTRPPQPFGENNYIVDVSAHKHGVNYAGVWTAEISGWSEQFLRFIAGLEGIATPTET